MTLQPFRIEQLAGQDGPFLVLVGIERRNSLLGGAELLFLLPGFLQHIQFTVPGQQQGGPFTDHQVVRGNLNALLVFNFLDQRFRIQRDSVSQDIDHPGAAHAGRQQMQVEFAEFIDDFMSRVGAALEPYDDIEGFRQQVNHSAFSFVTPVDAHECGTSHCFISSRIFSCSFPVTASKKRLFAHDHFIRPGRTCQCIQRFRPVSSKYFFQVFSGIGFLHGSHLFRGAFRHDRTAAGPALRAQVDDMVRNLDHVQVMLDHQH